MTYILQTREPFLSCSRRSHSLGCIVQEEVFPPVIFPVGLHVWALMLKQFVTRTSKMKRKAPAYINLILHDLLQSSFWCLILPETAVFSMSNYDMFVIFSADRVYCFKYVVFCNTISEVNELKIYHKHYLMIGRQ